MFVKKSFISHSGQKLDWKIECDDMTYSDVETLCYLISQKFKFFNVFGVPDGGLKFATCLKKYCSDNVDDGILVVDDVFTTGKSMNSFVSKNNIKNPKGVVIFSRGTRPDWITPVFQVTI